MSILPNKKKKMLKYAMRYIEYDFFLKSINAIFNITLNKG